MQLRSLGCQQPWTPFLMLTAAVVLCRAVPCCAVQVGILQKMQTCRNTVRLLGCYETNDEVMVVTGLCSGGDLQKLSDVSMGCCTSGACQHSCSSDGWSSSCAPVAM
jgi:hypothetical protein